MGNCVFSAVNKTDYSNINLGWLRDYRSCLAIINCDRITFRRLVGPALTIDILTSPIINTKNSNKNANVSPSTFNSEQLEKVVTLL